MKYLYCLVRGEGECRGFPAGMRGMAIHPIGVAAITALVSDVMPGGANRTVENALAQHEVVSHALACFPAVLPCRFGTVVRDDAEVVRLLATRYPRLNACLDTVQGKVEVGIRALLEERDSEESGPVASCVRQGRTPGERYLLGKTSQYRESLALEEQATRLTRALQEATSPCVEAIKVERSSLRKGLLLTLCCLVDRGNLTPFKQGYALWGRRYPRVRLLLTGPWAPYSFVDVHLTEQGEDIAIGNRGTR